MKAALYARVSTDAQETENQLIDLKRYCQQRSWEFQEFVDHGFSGALDASERPALRALLDAARRRHIGVVLAWDLSRLARSLTQLVGMVNDLRAWGVGLVTVRDSIDTATANGRMVFGLFATIAEFERELIRERVLLGIQRARENGITLGRPRSEFDEGERARMTLLAPELGGLSVRAASRRLGENGIVVSPATVHRWFVKGEIPGVGPVVVSQKPTQKPARAS